MSLLMDALKRAERDKNKTAEEESASEDSNTDLAVTPDWQPEPQPLQDQDPFPSIKWTEQPHFNSATAAAPAVAPHPNPLAGEGAIVKGANFDLLSLEEHAPAPAPSAIAAAPPVEAIQAQGAIPPLQAPAPKEEPAPAPPSPPRTESTLHSTAPTNKPSPDMDAATTQRQQHAAQVLAATKKPPNRNRLLRVIAGATTFLLLAGGLYLYWLYPQLASPQIASYPRPAPIMHQPEAAPADTVEPSTLTAPEPPPTLTDAKVAEKDIRPVAKQPPPPPAAPPAAQPPKEPAITIRRSAHAPQLAPGLARGYSAFMTGNDSQAQQEYAGVLQQDGNNRDALLGMAAIAIRLGRSDEAIKTYLRLQELDPRDAAAQAGLLALAAGQADPVQSESRVKTLLAQQPDSHFLHFALGNLYAGQSRWPEAQQAFFHAFQKSPNNPDYLYNLAISLDHLNQSKLALEYYQRALSQSGPANFDKTAARNRVMELQQPMGK